MTARPLTASDYLERWEVARAQAREVGADALVVSSGSDLAYLTGHDGKSYERLTAVVGHVSTSASLPRLITPQLEAERIIPVAGVFDIVGWTDAMDPIALVVDALPSSGRVLVSDALPAVQLLDLQDAAPNLEFCALNATLGGMRSVKSPAEREALRHVGSLVDRVLSALQGGDVTLVGRTEQEVADEISERLLAAGHDTVEFVIVASGPNSASPHHHPSDRVIQSDEMVLFDIGGSCNGFNSDSTRCVFTGEIPDDVRSAYDQLIEAQQLAFEAASPGGRLGDVDLAARRHLEAGGYGPEFIHRTGHGIGTEVHEHPYVTELNDSPIRVGNAFSIEPGIYRAGEWGMRLEDIVVVEDDGPVRCNNTNHDLASVTQA